MSAAILLVASVACFAACWALLRSQRKVIGRRRCYVDRATPSPIAIRFMALNDECAAARLISRVHQAPAGER